MGRRSFADYHIPELYASDSPSALALSDELLLEALSVYPITTVLSVGCGLDTRPWRLSLPSNLRWIEIDFADVLDYKDKLMADEKPTCHRERLTVDLNDSERRRAMYEAAGSVPALMITEGLLLYLPAATVEALAAESWKLSGVAHWVSNVTTSAFSEVLGGGTDTLRPIRHVQASDCLKGEQISRPSTSLRLGDFGKAKLYHRCWLCARTPPPLDGRCYTSFPTVSTERSEPACTASHARERICEPVRPL